MTTEEKAFSDYLDLSKENLVLRDLVREALPEMFTWGMQNADKTQFFATWIRKAQEATK